MTSGIYLISRLLI